LFSSPCPMFLTALCLTAWFKIWSIWSPN